MGSDGNRDGRGNRALRACMQTLVLLDLLFVHLTQIASTHWLAPLFVLAIAAPFLERFRERFLYRLLWNAGVLCFFGVLLQHALRADLASVLEDGLVLAVLCQVHLLNNLRSSQRPDLLFFNAFLIAIITGFMNRGVGFPVAFLVFAFAFVIGLQLLSATRGGSVLSPAVTRRMVVDGGRRAVFLLVLSMAVFLFWPRDFQRKAYFRGKFQVTTGKSAKLEIGFNEKLQLNRNQPVGGENRPALRVTLLDGATTDVSPLWRGATLGATNGGAWHPMPPGLRPVTEDPEQRWQGRRGRLDRSGLDAPGVAQVQVLRFDQDTERLFAPLGARALQLAPEHANGLLRPLRDGTIDTAETGDVRYELSLARSPQEPLGGRHADEIGQELLPYVELPETERIESARELAVRLRERLPQETDQHEIVAELSDHLATSFAYLPPGSEDAATSLNEFLRGNTGGHCEFFASALATMLRSLDVPCRVVTGFRSSRWDGNGRVLSFGTRDAHAWVEVNDPNAGWYAIDPSPILADAVTGASLWAELRARASSTWERVTQFDSERRAALFAWVRSLPGRGLIEVRKNPVRSTLVLLLMGLPVALVVQRRRTRRQPAIHDYRLALRRAQVRLLPGETPRELLARARSEGVPGDRLRALAAATRTHETQRYAA